MDVTILSEPSVLVGASDQGSCTRTQDEATAKLLDVIDGTVMALGDNAYQGGTASEYTNCYEPTWGRHKARTRPTPGQRDYTTAGAPGYFGYFGAAAGDPATGYYSYDLGNWHVVVLNSQLPVGVNSAQVKWLKADLSANGKFCTLAYWHTPYFHSSGGPALKFKPIWDVLYSNGVELVVNGDKRLYERFAKQDPTGNADPVAGIRQFVVGTGGAATNGFTSTLPNSEVRKENTFGVLKLTLDADNYSWQFVPIAGQTFTDQGTTSCHGEPPPVARPGGPYLSDGTVAFDGSASSDPQGDPLTYDWDFGDNTPHGTGARPSHTYATDGEYTVTLVVTDSKGNRSAAATTTATITPPTANPGGPYSGESVITFDGSGSKGKAPLSYDWDFGDETPHGTGATPTHEYAMDGTYTVTLTVTDADGKTSVPATTTATITNVPPTVNAGPDQQAVVNTPLTLRVTFTDPGPDSPWRYSINWGDGAAESGPVTDEVNKTVTRTHSYDVIGSYTITATVTDKDGASGSDQVAVQVSTTPAAQTLIVAGDIAKCSNDFDEATAQLIDAMPGTVLTVGDNAYPNGTADDYTNCYEPTWGRHKSRTYAALGNHEYDFGHADPTFDYYGDRAGPRGKGYYSFNLGEWHIVVLNDNSSYVPWYKDSEQDLWLRADLAANTKKCIMAVWHQPQFFSSDIPGGIWRKRENLWNALYEARADVIVNGHQHHYERFAPMTPLGARDDVNGVKEFIVGTGGGDLHGLTTIAPNSEVRSATFGVVKFTLKADSYDWEFVPIAGSTFRDSGSATCH